MGGDFGLARTLRRPRPCDFDLVFVQIGRLACEEHFRASADTITRWLEEQGKDKLIADRKAFVHWRRRLSRREGIRYPHRKRGRPLRVPQPLLMEAVRYLKSKRPEGTVIAPAGEGQWRIGTALFEPVELVAFAASLGFDPVSILPPSLKSIWAKPREPRPNEGSTLSRATDLRQIWARP